MDGLKDKVAIITGGTSGIGRAYAEAFSREGARVVVAGRRRQAGESLAKSLGGAAIFVATDVTREDDIKALVAHTLERVGAIDCVINSAGSTSKTGPIPDTDPKAFDHDFAMHVRAPFLAMKYVSATLAW